MVQKIGLIVGREWSWPPAFIEEVNRRGAGVVAEYVTLGTPAMEEGTSADRQLATWKRTGDFKDVVDQLIRETAEGVV